jgi:hypothetical protein
MVDRVEGKHIKTSEKAQRQRAQKKQTKQRGRIENGLESKRGKYDA